MESPKHRQVAFHLWYETGQQTRFKYMNPLKKSSHFNIGGVPSRRLATGIHRCSKTFFISHLSQITHQGIPMCAHVCVTWARRTRWGRVEQSMTSLKVIMESFGKCQNRIKPLYRRIRQGPCSCRQDWVKFSIADCTTDSKKTDHFLCDRIWVDCTVLCEWKSLEK